MKWVRKIVGWLAVTFGTAGFIVCLAGLVGVWVLNHQIQRPTREVLNQAAALCAQGATGADHIAAELESSRDIARGLQDLIQKKIRQKFELSDEEVAQMESRYEDLRFAIQRVRDWIGLAETTLGFINQSVDLASSTWGYVQADSSTRANLGTALHNGAQKVEEAGLLLDQVHQKVLVIQAHGNPNLNLEEIETLSSRIDGVLVHLKEQALLFAAEVLGLGDAIERLHAYFQSFLFRCAIGLTLLLIWLAAAQAALVILGQRLIQSRPEPRDGSSMPAAENAPPCSSRRTPLL